MKRSRFTEEQIIEILREQEAGVPVADLCRKHGLRPPTFNKWKAKYAEGEAVDDASQRAHAIPKPASTDLKTFIEAERARLVDDEPEHTIIHDSWPDPYTRDEHALGEAFEKVA